MVLADHGAEVVRIESPRGDPTLSEAGERLWSRGKTRIALDMRDTSQRRDAHALIAEADLVIVGLRPTTAESWGLSYDALSRENKGLILTTVTGFGWDGPFREEPATEGLMQALSGQMLMPMNGALRDGPAYIAPHMASYATAMLSVQAILAALRERDASGQGQHVDASLYDGILAYRGFVMWNPEKQEEDFPVPAPGGDPRGIRPLFNLNECADGGWLSMGAWTPALTYKALDIMDKTELLADERFAGMPNVIEPEESRPELLETLWATFRTRPLQTWLDQMDAEGIPSEPALTIEQFREVSQLWANDLAIHVDDPVVGSMVQQGVLGQFSQTPGSVRAAEAEARPAAASQEVAQRWRQAQPVKGNGTFRADGRGPLAGVRVLDLTVFLSGPMAAHLLTDLGADVIKAESPGGDDFRVSAPYVFRYLHRDKKGIVLDLKTPEGQAGLEQLVRESDVVVYNYRLGVEERLGLSYERLKEINPNVVVNRITAFGPRGDRAHRGGYDASVTALAGMCQLQAGDGNPPVSIGMADISTGLISATAMSLAIRAQETQGVGQLVDTCMIGAMAYVGADAFSDYEGKPANEVMDNGQHGISPLNRLYQTSDGWLLLAVHSKAQAEQLRKTLRIEGSGILDGIALQRSFATRTTNGWLTELQPAGVACADAMVDYLEFMTKTPELRANQSYLELPHPVYGNLGQAGPGARFSRTPVRIERQEPELGQHTEEILRGAISSPTP